MDDQVLDTGVEEVSAAEGQDESQVEVSESGAEEVAAEPAKQNNYEKAFAKRLAEKEAQWKTEKDDEIQKLQSQYKDYDVSQKALQYLQRTSGITDVMSLKEQIELADLQDRAESQNLTVEELQRRQELEDLKAWKSEVEQQQQQTQWESTYWSGINEFAKAKGVESEALNQFMIDNEMHINPNNLSKSFEFALKAMKYDEVQAKLETAEKDGVKKFLQAKGSIPTVTGNTAQGQVTSQKPKTFAEARARAMQRLSD